MRWLTVPMRTKNRKGKACNSGELYHSQIVGSGTFKLLLIKGSTVSLTSQYYVAYSAASNVDHYSNTFQVSSSDGTDFTIMIVTDVNDNITYSISISFSEPSALDAIAGGILFCLIIFFPVTTIVVIIAIVLYLKRRKAKRAAAQYGVPGQPYPQPQAASFPPPPPMPPPQPETGYGNPCPICHGQMQFIQEWMIVRQYS